MRRRFLLLIVLTVLGTPTYAATTLQVRDAWIQEAPPGASVLAAYLVIANAGAQSRVLLSVTSPDFAAVEIHTSQIINGTASMTQLKDLTIPAQGEQVLAAGATHLMLLRPKHALRAGDTARLRLHFSDATALDVTAKVMRATSDIPHQH